MLTDRLMALPEELRIKIIGEMVKIDYRISLLIFTIPTQTRCLLFMHHDHLLAIAEEQVIRNNTFWWPRTAPAITLEAGNIRHLEMDLSLTIDGGDILFPTTFDLPTLDAAKLTAIPYFFPKLGTLVINVDHTLVISPGAWYTDITGFMIPAAAFPEAVRMERCWKIAEIIQRVRGLYFPRCRRNETLKRKVFFMQGGLTEGMKGNMRDPMELMDMGRYKRRIYAILGLKTCEVYFGEGSWDR